MSIKLLLAKTAVGKLGLRFKAQIRIWRRNWKFSPTYLRNYAKWIYEQKNDDSQFIQFTQNPYVRHPGDVKVFAFYLTQFHAIPENDKAYGKGFTEWNNVTTCVPQFIGHDQPKIPYDLGFYNLEMPGVMERQAEIARAYGVYGWTFYYYWFMRKRALEKPLNYFLNNKIDMHFHLCWANENWSRKWDGGDNDLIFESKLDDGAAKMFFDDLLPYIKDNRYEKVGNKPILMIYRPEVFDKDILGRFMVELNNMVKEAGFDGLFYMASDSCGFHNPVEWGFEGLIEFPPHGIHPMFGECKEIFKKRLLPNTDFKVWDADRYIYEERYLYDVPYRVFKACNPGWDNLARKTFSRGNCFLLSDNAFEKWFKDIVEWTRKTNPQNMQYVYVNAWNEWGEGAILEPTIRYGYKYLQMIKDILEEMRN